MKTIEEMAYRYAYNKLIPDARYDNASDVRSMQCVLVDFARKVSAERERWRDPRKELPEDDRDVIIKTTMCRRYGIAFYKKNGERNYHWHENNGAIDDDMVIGWRPIHDDPELLKDETI